MDYQVSIKELNKLALPAILYNITEPLIGLADTAIIGQIPEHATQAQGGVGLAVGLISTLVWGLAQVRTAVSALVSKYLGMDRINDVKTLVPQALAFSILLGTLFWLLTDGFYEEISNFLFSEKNERVNQFSQKYYHIRSIGLPLSLFIAGVFGVFRGYQNTYWAMIISIVGGVANIILDLVLVNGLGELIPPMGVEGAAIASLMAQTIMVVLCGYYLINRTPFNLRISFRLNPEFSNMFYIALNMLVRTLALNVTFILALRYASDYGEQELAAYAIGINIWLFSSFFIDGYSNAGNAMAGKYLGENDHNKLNSMAWVMVKINLKIAIGLSLIYLISYPFIGSLFNPDKEVQAIFNSFFWVVIISQPLNSIAFSFDGIFKGLGEAKLLRNVLILGTFGIFIPILILLDKFEAGIFSIWIAFVAWMLWRAALLTVKFKNLIASK